MTISNRKLYEFACQLLTRYKEDETIDLKEESRKFDSLNSKDRKKMISLVVNYSNHKDDVKMLMKDNKIKCKKHNLNKQLIRMMLTEILYSPCFKETTFNDWKEWIYLNDNFKDQINEKKKTIVLRQLPVKQDKKRKCDETDKNEQLNTPTTQMTNQLTNQQIKKQNKKIKKQNDDHLDLFKDVKELTVKYLRVNRIKTTIDELVYELVNDLGFIQVGRKFDCFNDFLKKLFNLNSNEFMIDYHFPDDLIVVPSDCKKQFQDYRMYQEGRIIFQDKASLIPLKCAQLQKGMRIADICCCPGMKTFGISSSLKNDCDIISVDIDAERIEVMKGLMKKLGVECTKIIEKDFTKTTNDDFKFTDGSNDIDVLFLDPSCSGSGMIDKRSAEEFEEKQNDDDRKRLMKLASFQTKLLCHAMSLRPKLIIYSTCSFSVWENEFVICKVEEQAQNRHDYKLIDAWPEWHQRGNKKFTCSNQVIRASPSKGCRGFFTAVFQLKK